MNVTVKHKQVLILAHADGDGHLAAEQSRRNALAAGTYQCSLLVDPRITAGYRFWTQHLHDLSLGDYDVVVFIDIMFHPKQPTESFEALAERARREPDRAFLMIDHHPMAGLPRTPANLDIQFTPEVYRCCYGPPSDLMVVASLCDRDEGPVAAMVTERHRRRAKGVSRAVADRKHLAGQKLLNLLARDRWDLLEALGDEDTRSHHTVWGVRPSGWEPTAAIAAARIAAD